MNNTDDKLEVLGSNEEMSAGAFVHAPSYSCSSSVLGYTLKHTHWKRRFYAASFALVFH